MILMAFKSKHEFLQHEIKKMIKDQKMEPGTRLPSEHEFQEKYDVSRHTVRTALNRLEHQGIIYKEQGSGSFVADTKKRGLHKEIGVITTYISDYIFPTIIRGIEKELTNRGYSMILTSTNNNVDMEKKAMEMMMNRDVDGLIIEPTQSAYYNPNIGMYLHLKEMGIPLVMINAKYDEIDTTMVVLDDYKAGYDVTKYLIEQGHTNIGGIFKVDDRQGKERLRGYIQACYEYGVEYNSKHVLIYETETLLKVLQDQITPIVKNKQVTGFVCYNDRVAIELLNIIWQLGFQVTDDFSIVSHDNSTLSSMTKVHLTGIDHPKSDLGQTAAQELLDYVEGKNEAMKSHMFKGKIVVKNSVKKLT